MQPAPNFVPKVHQSQGNRYIPYGFTQSNHEIRQRSSAPASEDAPMTTQNPQFVTIPPIANAAPGVAVNQGVLPVAACTECDARIQANVALSGEILDCPDCGAELEVRSVSPLVLAVAPAVEEDWGE